MSEESLELFVCRRIRAHSETGCGKNLDKESFALIKSLEEEYDINIVPRGCLGVCPYQGFAIQREHRPEVVTSFEELREKIEAYKKAKVLESTDGYSNR